MKIQMLVLSVLGIGVLLSVLAGVLLYQNGYIDFSGLSKQTLEYKYLAESKAYAVVGIEDPQEGNIVIPNYHRGEEGNLPVVSIGESAFEGREDIVSVSFQSDSRVSLIGESAFAGCTNLSSVVFPSSIKEIESAAFFNCNQLMSITLPSGLESIGSYAFKNCFRLAEIYDLTNMSIREGSDSNGFVGYYAVQIHDDESDKTIIFEYGDYTFARGLASYYLVKYNGTSEEVSLPISLEYNGKTIMSYRINSGAFYKDVDLKSIIIPSGIYSIGESAFGNCSILESVTFQTIILDKIADSTFSGCTNLRSISIPSGVEEIGASAFNGCLNLRNVDVPTSITTIGDSAFFGCMNMLSFVIPSGVTYIGEYAFNLCDKLEEIYNFTNIDLSFDEEVYERTKLSARVIHDDIEDPSILFKDGDYTFAYYDEKYYLMEYSGTETQVILPTTAAYGDLSITNYNIHTAAFWNCADITKIIIPVTVSAIGDYAFYGCTGLQEVCYTGTKNDWDLVTKGVNNSELTKATITYDYVLD